jgi:4-hydroxyphenylpyruvate dioxygenase
VRTSIATVSLSGSLPEKLQAAAGAGFDGIELFENDLITSRLGPAEIRRRAADLGLSIDLYQPFRDFEAVPEAQLARNLHRAERKFDLMVQLGAPTLLVCSNVRADAIDDDARATDQLHQLAERAAAHGLRIAYEALAWGRHVHDYQHAWRLVRDADHPALGVCLDSFHILTRSVDPAGIRDLPGEKIFYLQLADAPGLDMDALHFSRHYRCFPGQGVFDLAGFTGHVLAAGYSGPFSLEVFNDVFRQAEAERTAIDAMRSLIILNDAVTPTLPAVSQPRGFAFTEITVDARSAESVQDLLARMGFRHTGTHRSKRVELWQQGAVRLLLNRSHPDRAEWGRGDAAVSVIAVEDPESERSAVRAEALLAPRAARAIDTDEARLPAFVAPDGTAIFFCQTDAPGNWLDDFDLILDADEPKTPEPPLVLIDHVALSPSVDHYDETLLFYQAAFGLKLRPNEEFADPYGLLRSRAVATTAFRLVFNAPVVSGAERSSPSGAQHIAFSCPDIFAAARFFRAHAVPQLPIPDNYYDDLAARTELLPSRIEQLREHGILYDRTDDGEFFQIFTVSVSRSLFFEVVQRTASYEGFGAPNAPVRRAMQA